MVKRFVKEYRLYAQNYLLSPYNEPMRRQLGRPVMDYSVDVRDTMCVIRRGAEIIEQATGKIAEQLKRKRFHPTFLSFCRWRKLPHGRSAESCRRQRTHRRTLVADPPRTDDGHRLAPERRRRNARKTDDGLGSRMAVTPR